MRCASCGADMRLMGAATDGGDAHRLWQCTGCYAIARRPVTDRDDASPRAPAPLHPAPPLSVLSAAESDLDECEVMLRRAIEMVRDATRRSRSTKIAPDERVESPAGSAGAPPLHGAPLASALAETGNDVDECQVMLGRAIEMVRGPAHWPAPIGGLADGRPELPVRSEPSRVVRVDHDLEQAVFVARDTTSGLSILRHQDRARLRAMCERIGWRVLDE